MFYKKNLKDIRNPSKCDLLTFRKKNNAGCLLNFYKKIQIFSQDFLGTLWKNISFIPMKSNKNQNISYNNSGVTTNQIEQLRCYNQSNWTYKLNKSYRVKKTFFFLSKILQRPFFFLILFPLLPVLPPASFSPLMYHVRNLFWAARAFMLPLHTC